jgi:hypothetical protein
LAGNQEAMIILIPDPLIFHKSYAPGLQSLPYLCPDTFTGLKVKSPIRRTADNDIVDGLFFGYARRFVIEVVSAPQLYTSQ